ncbi:MAG: hypothetical protein JXQ96_08925 [Cyclobacteriaceae bacterium]
MDQAKHKKVFFWILGFVILFLINVFVEAILLPYWDLDNTDKNDIYFQSWWVVVGIWLLFGRKFLDLMNGKTENQ